MRDEITAGRMVKGEKNMQDCYSPFAVTVLIVQLRLTRPTVRILEYCIFADVDLDESDACEKTESIEWSFSNAV